jgi:transposase
MLNALVAGNSEPEEIAALVRGRLREKIPQLQRALAGHFGLHQRFLVAQQLAHIDFLDETLPQIDKEISDRLHPFELAVADRLDAIPGVAQTVAQVVIAEIGTNVSRLPSADHLSWVGLCPGNK